MSIGREVVGAIISRSDPALLNFLLTVVTNAHKPPVSQCKQKAVLAECSLLLVIKITLIIIDSHLITSDTLSPSLRVTMTMLLLSDLAW